VVKDGLEGKVSEGVAAGKGLLAAVVVGAGCEALVQAGAFVTFGLDEGPGAVACFALATATDILVRESNS
jgi:hypothetical protein